jgi:hypothetical protein
MTTVPAYKSETSDSSFKKVELPFLLLLSAIVIAKIVLQLAMPESTAEAQWKKNDPKAASIFASK